MSYFFNYIVDPHNFFFPRLLLTFTKKCTLESYNFKNFHYFDNIQLQGMFFLNK